MHVYRRNSDVGKGGQLPKNSRCLLFTIADQRIVIVMIWSAVTYSLKGSFDIRLLILT